MHKIETKLTLAVLPGAMIGVKEHSLGQIKKCYCLNTQRSLFNESSNAPRFPNRTLKPLEAFGPMSGPASAEGLPISIDKAKRGQKL